MDYDSTVSEPTDGDGGREVIDEVDVPPTRKHDALPVPLDELGGPGPAAVPPAEAPEAPVPPGSHDEPDAHARLVYPDDGPVSRAVRRFDDGLGRVEQVVLVALLAAVVLTGAGHALLERFAHIRLPFKDDVIRAGTFAIAMLGAAFASHQARHLSMDLISRRLSPRARLFLKVALAAFLVFIVALLIRAGFHNIDNEREFAAEDKLVTRVRIAWLIPIGGFLIILHTVLHMVIDIDYIARRKTPPERMRSGH